MERRGLRFVQFKGQFAVLERGEPRETRYRYCAVEAGMDEIFERERLKYADFGWELLYNTTMRVGYNGEYCLARTVDPAAVEMYTDKESFGALASKQLFISAVVLAVLIAIDIFRFLRICQVGLTELVEYERRVLPLLIMLPLLLCCRIYYGAVHAENVKASGSRRAGQGVRPEGSALKVHIPHLRGRAGHCGDSSTAFTVPRMKLENAGSARRSYYLSFALPKNVLL